jgi:hypothetical protein
MASPDSFRKDFTHLPILLFQRNEGMAKMCHSTTKLVSIILAEPRATLKKDQAIDVIITSDTGQRLPPSHGVALSPTDIL